MVPLFIQSKSQSSYNVPQGSTSSHMFTDFLSLYTPPHSFTLLQSHRFSCCLKNTIRYILIWRTFTLHVPFFWNILLPDIPLSKSILKKSTSQWDLLWPPFIYFPGGSDSKASAYNVETWVWSLGWEDPLEKEMATHCSTMTCKSHGRRILVGYSPPVFRRVAKSQIWLSN